MMRVKGQMSQMVRKKEKSQKYQMIKKKVEKKVRRMKVKGQINQMKKVEKRVKGMKGQIQSNKKVKIMGKERGKRKDLFLIVEGIDLLFGNKPRSLKEPMHK